MKTPPRSPQHRRAAEAAAVDRVFVCRALLVLTCLVVVVLSVIYAISTSAPSDLRLRFAAAGESEEVRVLLQRREALMLANLRRQNRRGANRPTAAMHPPGLSRANADADAAAAAGSASNAVEEQQIDKILGKQQQHGSGDGSNNIVQEQPQHQHLLYLPNEQLPEVHRGVGRHWADQDYPRERADMNLENMRRELNAAIDEVRRMEQRDTKHFERLTIRKMLYKHMEEHPHGPNLGLPPLRVPKAPLPPKGDGVHGPKRRGSDQLSKDLELARKKHDDVAAMMHSFKKKQQETTGLPTNGPGVEEIHAVGHGLGADLAHVTAKPTKPAAPAAVAADSIEDKEENVHQNGNAGNTNNDDNDDKVKRVMEERRKIQQHVKEVMAKLDQQLAELKHEARE